MVKRNEQLEGRQETRPAWLSATNQEELIKQAKSMLDGRNDPRMNQHKGGHLSEGNSDSSILQRLDRMIRAIKEHDHITGSEYEPFGESIALLNKFPYT